jgi:hypothetical protein
VSSVTCMGLCILCSFALLFKWVPTLRPVFMEAGPSEQQTHLGVQAGGPEVDTSNLKFEGVNVCGEWRKSEQGGWQGGYRSLLGGLQ